jgi:8-oxo-dGTP diphosphatase
VELCDVVDESGAPTGRTVARGTRLMPGEYYLVVHVWIKDAIGDYLVQQRAHDRATDPGIWAVTAGYVQAGEDSLVAAIRETSEELGLELSPDQFRRLKRHAMDDRVEDIWLAIVSRASLVTPKLGPEVADWKWVSKARLSELVSRGEFYGYSYFDRLPDY